MVTLYKYSFIIIIIIMVIICSKNISFLIG